MSMQTYCRSSKIYKGKSNMSWDLAIEVGIVPRKKNKIILERMIEYPRKGIFCQVILHHNRVYVTPSSHIHPINHATRGKHEMRGYCDHILPPM